jgi:NADH:ubiquinone oxidoreductase subunit K
MMPGGALAEVFGALVGVGKGKGIALLIIAAGAASVGIALTAASYRPLRRLDTEETARGSAAPVPASVEG